MFTTFVVELEQICRNLLSRSDSGQAGGSETGGLGEPLNPLSHANPSQASE